MFVNQNDDVDCVIVDVDFQGVAAVVAASFAIVVCASGKRLQCISLIVALTLHFQLTFILYYILGCILKQIVHGRWSNNQNNPVMKFSSLLALTS
jgi:hypothetical protein